MFKVWCEETATVNIVYAVRTQMQGYIAAATLFLVYNKVMETWEWNHAELYVPYIEDKHAEV